MNRIVIRRYFSILFALAAMPVLHGVDADATPSMTGHWEGSTRVIVTWCGQPELSVSLDIAANGNVTGRIGDAELTNAQLKRKRNWFGKDDDRRTTHIIKGDLKGPIVAAEGITRREVFIHLRFDEAHLSGSLATSGSKMGGKESMVLTTISLRLVRS
jgi:hypothetical protein